MPNPWKEKIIAYNKRRAEADEKAADMAIVAEHLALLPWGQLKKLLDDELIAVLAKYGIGTDN